MIHIRTLQSLEYGKIVDELVAHCASEAGRDLAASVLPLNSRQEAEAATALYSEARLWASSSQFIITAFPDTRRIMDLLLKKRGPGGLPQGFSLDLDTLWAAGEMLRLAQAAAGSIITQSGAGLWPSLLAMAAEQPMPLELLAALNRCLTEDGLLRDGSSPELFRLRSELRGLHQSCLRKVRDYAEQYNMLPFLQDEFMTLSSDRYVLPLKANFKGRMQGIIHDWSQTGETCYFEPYFLVDINNRLQELKHEEREEERRIREYLTGLFDRELPGVESAANLLAKLDYLQSARKLAEKLNAETITFSDHDAGISLLAARHPLLALSRLGKTQSPPVKPLDIVLRPGERALIITGGNAGGKTVCLKTLGLLAAMAMSGLPVPCQKGSHLPWFERIDAFIGDEQSIAENASTFSAQIDHLAKAFKYLDQKALALLDEFGAGTDPAEGAALAQAVHDELLDKNCFVFSATHFPALKSYALSKPGARAASMLFDSRTNKPLFKLAYDQVGSSQALAVAAEHGLPESILNRARHYLLQDGEDTTAVLERLNDLAALREQELGRLKEQEAKNNAVLAEKRERLEREKKRLQAEIKEKISELMVSWKEGRANARQTMKGMSGLRAELGLEEKSPILPQPGNLAIGQQVLHSTFNKHGIIKEIDARRGKARVDLNGVTLWAELKDLRVCGHTASENCAPRTAVRTGGPLFSLDVRGQRAAEALAEVERFLDKAVLGGSTEVEIIHGRGTGALRREIHSYLRSSPAVEKIELAPEDRGGDGMTIVTLK